MSNYPNGGEPDPRKTGAWRSMFEQPRGAVPQAAPGPAPAEFDDSALEEAAAVNTNEYRPWITQRGRSRPAMMLELRRYEPRSGFWQGWIMAYPSLRAVEYVGNRALSLDFGSRQFMIEGTELGDLMRHLQQGTVLAIQEYSAKVWPQLPPGPVVTSINKCGDGASLKPRDL